MNQKQTPSPFQKFVSIESLGGILLFAATLVAFLWANSPLADTYDALWNYKLGIQSDHLTLVKPVRLWVNDGLMAIFFFLIGLEIKRELKIGELNTPKKAALPLVAALGGMLMPAGLFLLLNKNPEAMRGWGIPIATDIAFSLAVLKLLGNRIPMSLKVFLTAFAIVDDLGAILVIALFYSTGIQWGLLAIGLAIILLLAGLSYANLYSKYLLLILGAVAWFLFLKSGIHPTIAGVLLALTVPVRQKTDLQTFAGNVEEIVNVLQTCPPNSKPILTHRQIEIIDDLEDWTQRVQSPLQHLEHKLHNWVAWVIMPVFALANAGVNLSGASSLDFPLILTIALSLFIGKTTGISLFTWLSHKTGITEFPSGARMKSVLGVASLAGIGFTMSIFIAGLAFAGNPALADSAKIGILAGSVISGLGGYFMLRMNRRDA
jgi:NhaA family Na+:H+ antiporter